MPNATEPCPDAARPVVEVTVRIKYPDGSERVPPSRSAERLLLFLALHGGTAHCEDAIRALWPDVDLATGRRRLRNTLAQICESCGPIVRREGKRLTLHSPSG